MTCDYGLNLQTGLLWPSAVRFRWRILLWPSNNISWNCFVSLTIPQLCVSPVKTRCDSDDIFIYLFTIDFCGSPGKKRRHHESFGSWKQRFPLLRYQGFHGIDTVAPARIYHEKYGEQLLNGAAWNDHHNVPSAFCGASPPTLFQLRSHHNKHHEMHC